ncbi:MAG: hypothetical protein CL543_07305 [Alcanivorax sp.]|nr:hypothetical protein [Alcanivorax sp.]
MHIPGRHWFQRRQTTGLEQRPSRRLTMKKATTLALVLLTGATLAGTAAAEPPRGPQPERMVEHMSRQLDLTDDQRARLETIFEEQGEKMRDLRDETRQRIDGVLTEEQRAKAEQLREQRQEKWEARKDKWKERRDQR